MTYSFSLLLGSSRPAALTAGAFTAMSPLLVYFSCRMMSETLFVFLVLSFFLVWMRSWITGSLPAAAAAGLLGGLASLTRPVFAPFGAVLALIACWKRRQQSRWAVLVMLCGACWVSSILPWTYYNWLRFQRFVFITAQGGSNLYEGMSLDLEDIRLNRPKAMGEEARSQGILDPFEMNAYFGRKARAWILKNPLAFARLTFLKAVKFWRPFPYPPHSMPVRWATGLFTIALFLAALLSVGRMPSRGAPFLLGWMFCLTMIHAVFASNLRYRLPLEPFLAVLAGSGLFFSKPRPFPPQT